MRCNRSSRNRISFTHRFRLNIPLGINFQSYARNGRWRIAASALRVAVRRARRTGRNLRMHLRRGSPSNIWAALSSKRLRARKLRRKPSRPLSPWCVLFQTFFITQSPKPLYFERALTKFLKFELYFFVQLYRLLLLFFMIYL